MPDEVIQRRGREGGRWINERPSSEEFATWFRDSMKIDERLNIEDYIGGVVLIPALDTKAKYVTGFTNQGVPVIEAREELSYIPYAKVETRINYFWDLVAAHQEDWVAVVEHVESPRLPLLTPLEEVVEAIIEAETGREKTITKRKQQQAGALGQMVHQLPAGFSIMSVAVGDAYSHFVCCTMRVSIYRRADYENKQLDVVHPLRTGRGTKQVPLHGSYQTRVWADSSSLMKAETGALGRALGFAGIFIIPGSGVATAEDMLEAISQGETPAQATAATETNAGPAAPEEAPVRTDAERAADDESVLRGRAAQLFGELSPAEKADFTSWAQKRKLGKLSDARGATLRGVVKKLERLVDERKEGGSEHPGEAQEAETPERGGEEASGDGDESSGQAG